MSSHEQDQASDLLIQEVDEDLRREQYLKLWKTYGKYAIAAVAAIILGVAGHGFWQQWRDRQFQTEAARFAAAQDLLTAGKKDEAKTKLAEVIAAKDGGFSVAAAFQQADMLSEGDDLAGAMAAYDAIAASNAPQIFKDLAVIKRSMLALSKEDPQALAARLQPIALPANPWHGTALELLAVLAQKRGDQPAAIAYYKQISDDAALPQDLRARAGDMLAALGVAPAGNAATINSKPVKG